MLIIDGSQGEGGGQVLRSALALSLCTGTPFRIERIRARRQKPGLQKQHLTAVLAAARVGGAEATGATLGSPELTFRPSRAGVHPGEYHFSVGTAGSATLVLQTVLPPLLTAEGPSTLILEGGTCNPMAPPYDFLARSFLPLVGRMGPRIEASLDRHGFYPAGGGRFTVSVAPVERLAPLKLETRGALLSRQARIILSRLPRHIADRELRVLAERLDWPQRTFAVDEVESPGPGNAVLVEVGSAEVTQIFTAFGEKGRPAERVAEEAADLATAYLRSDIAVDEHLADQLLLPIALAGEGSFTTGPLSQHATTNADVIRLFTGVEFQIEPRDEEGRAFRIEARAG